MKRAIIIAGPNGAGKTTFAREFLPREADCVEFVNADLIAAGLSPFRPERVAIAAGRLMLHRIDELVSQGTDFALETTLASRTYRRKISAWQSAGYRVELHFLQLPDSDFAVRRVAQRVCLGGHSIPEETIRRRFARGWQNFNGIYKSLVDYWCLYDGGTMPPHFIKNSETEPLQESPGAYEGKPSRNTPFSPAGALAALKRGAEKAVAQARAADLDPVIAPERKSEKSRSDNRTVKL